VSYKKIIPWSRPKIFKEDKLNLNKAINSSWISGGEYIEKFEKKISKMLSIKYVSCVNNGTSALHAAFLALDLKRGDEIAVPGFGYLAAANIAKLMGLSIKFVDVDYNTYCMDYHSLKNTISKKTKAVIFIHTYGNGGDIKKISKFLKKKKITLIEDAAEALGSKSGSKYLGTIGDIGTFSFHATKNITTGEGGCVVTRDKNFSSKIKLFRSHGVKSKRYFHYVPGHNFRLTNLQAAIGYSQISKIKLIISRRKEIYKEYLHLFKSHNRKNISFQKITNDIQFVPWTFAVNLKINNKNYRDNIMKKMFNKKIETRNGFYFPKDLPMFKGIKKLKNSSKLSKQVICLPIYYDLNKKLIKKIIKSFVECLDKSK
tara:strand:+ start:2242 stop:3357 length:1116 start_codon:yes stop_codon:yes gene_type:complete